MKQNANYSLLLLLSFLLISCKKESKDAFINEVTPWCIVTFDKAQRTPIERIEMLKEMGIYKYGYNWREKNLANTKEEFRLAKENNIEISSTLIWLNAKRDSIGKLSPRNKKMLGILKDVEHKPKIWLSFSDNFFKELNQEESIDLATRFIKHVKTQTDEIDCKLALYNHRGWFGNPFNQVEILQRLAIENINIQMVYNFHHAHHYVEKFPKVVKAISPYVYHINLNGMKKEGPEILTLGKGDLESKMIHTLLENGYTGSWGILGHINEEDVKEVLQRNLEGYNYLISKR